MINVKLNIKPRDFWSVIVAMASVALCAAIDILLRGSDDEDSENHIGKDC